MLVANIQPLQTKQQEIAQGNELNTILAEGALQAQKIANTKIQQVKRVVGLI